MEKEILFPESQKIKLSQGADLYCLNTDEYKRSRLDIFFTFPADKYKSPLIRLLLSVLFRGSKNFPTLTHMNKHLDRMYDSTVYWKDYHLGANHTYRISCTTLDKKYLPKKDVHLDLLEETLKVIEDVLLDPLYDEDGLLSEKFFESEREFAIDNINAALSSPKAYASLRCQQMLFGDDPAGYSISGTEELLRSYTRAELTAIREYFLKCSAITAYYVGTESGEEISKKLKPIFDRIGDRTPLTITPKYALPTQKYCEAEEEFNLSQGRLHIGLTCGSTIGDSDSAAMSLYNEILGGSSTSKLFMNVRERKSLCYSCYSGINSGVGTMIISCGIKPENKDVALCEIKNQIEQMRLGNISDEEIASAKKGLINSLNQMPDTAASLVAASFKYKLLANTDVSIQEKKEQIISLTKEDVIAFAQKVTLCSVFFLTSSQSCENTDSEDCDDE